MPPVTPAGTLDRPPLPIEGLNPRAWRVGLAAGPPAAARTQKGADWEALRGLESRAAWKIAERLNLDGDRRPPLHPSPACRRRARPPRQTRLVIPRPRNPAYRNPARRNASLRPPGNRGPGGGGHTELHDRLAHLVTEPTGLYPRRPPRLRHPSLVSRPTALLARSIDSAPAESLDGSTAGGTAQMPAHSRGAGRVPASLYADRLSQACRRKAK